MASLRSSSDRSLLVKRFTERVLGQSDRNPEDAILFLVEPVNKRSKALKQLHRLMRDRHIAEITVSVDLKDAGRLEPLGGSFSDGFRLRLRKDASPERSRFTLAHELCHTYFYEYVPELKYLPHEIDPEEEHLCNVGAAEILVPAIDLRKQAKGRCVSIRSLEDLAKRYAVSAAMMVCRLNDLDLWDCRLSSWRRMTNGRFAMATYFGGRRIDWEWEDDSALRSAWDSAHAITRQTFVSCIDSAGSRQYAPVTCECQRHGEYVVVLWGAGIGKMRMEEPRPLLTRALEPSE